MTIHFISESEITLDKYLYWAGHPIGRNARKKLRTANMINIFGILFSAVGGRFCLHLGSNDIALVYGGLLLAFVYKTFFHRRRANKKLYTQTIIAQGGGVWLRTITFGSNIQVSDGNTTSTYKYSDFRKVSRDSRHYLLFMNEDLVLRVEKGSFTTGNEADFLPFLKKRIRDKM